MMTGETMLLMSEQYKGMWVDARVYKRADGSGWTANVFVGEYEEEDLIFHKFPVKVLFESEEVAINRALATGRKIVDDKLKGDDIGAVIKAATRLPSTHRSAYGSHSDDVAAGVDGNKKRVPTAGNPDDHFD